MKSSVRVAALVASLGVGVPAIAATVKGSVRNLTTGKPSAGDEVVLFSVSERGPAEVGRGKTDSAGRFVVTAKGPAAPTVVRVAHQGVGYQAAARPGGKDTVVNVYDIARTLDAVTATWDVRLQADSDSLKVIDEITVLNASNPPRALLNPRPFSIHLPPEAEVLAGAVQSPGGQAVKAKPAAGERTGEHYFTTPLLPGETRFAVAWRLPYRGNATIEPRSPYPLKRIVVSLPESMTFEAASPGVFRAKPDETWAVVKETASPGPGQSFTFRVSGTGTLGRVRGETKLPQVGQTAPSHGEQTATSHAGQTAPSHGSPAGSVPPARSLLDDRRLVVGGLVLALLATSALLLVYRRRQLGRLSA